MEENNLAAMEINEDEEIKDLKDLDRKMKLTGTVLNTSLAGALVDIGLEVPGVVHISQLQVEPVNRVEDVVQPGQTVDVWVRRVVPSKQRIELTMIEPLPLEWREISKDMVLKGKITRLERFGAFVDIGAERPGLVHISEIAHGYIKSPDEVIHEGDEVEVKVLSVNRRRKQIKLSMKALETPPSERSKPEPKKKRKKVEQEEPEVEEAVPTAMEIAMRSAMERNQTQDEEPVAPIKREAKKNGDEYEDILNRTLEQRDTTTK
jgi:ribosomal protein S1